MLRCLVAGALLTVAVAAIVASDMDIESLLLGDGLSRGGLTAGNVAAATLWSTSLWFVSPLQLLLLFLGRIETERPSDWAMNLIARGANLPVDNIDYEHPSSIRAVAFAGTIAAGCSVAYILNVGLANATWGVSSGIASCMAAGVYELGRPERISGEEAMQLENQWQTFGAY